MPYVKVMLTDEEYEKAAAIAVSQGRTTKGTTGIPGVIRAALRPYLSKNYKPPSEPETAGPVERNG